MTSLFPLPSPSLPPFATLLIKGPFHASAPIHLCLTHVASRPDTRALVLTPSQEKWRKSLCDFNDDWLNECGGFGAVSQMLSKVDIFYPPTTSHVALLLSMFRVSDISEEMAFNSRTTLDAPPSLIVLHELSAYFLDENASCSALEAKSFNLEAASNSTQDISLLAVMAAVDDGNGNDESFVSNILTPGSSLNPAFLLILDAAFAFLFMVLVSVAILTSGNIHLLALIAIELALWASVKWFVNELNNTPVTPLDTKAEETKKTS
ncbi:hypothetical protein EWM64_g3738 [Hericium alpestre]|uniref:Uncharacterized protein n=1 Tax=Hericium alpestre TaxID=135208 RepID=A0A4Z0A245_9AGAM|nr:hypothetical protein EWM64_g3738 [Hericium alpestre]